MMHPNVYAHSCGVISEGMIILIIYYDYMIISISNLDSLWLEENIFRNCAATKMPQSE